MIFAGRIHLVENIADAGCLVTQVKVSIIASKLSSFSAQLLCYFCPEFARHAERHGRLSAEKPRGKDPIHGASRARVLRR